MPIIVYNRSHEDHSISPNNYPIYRGGSILGNPYTDKPLKKTLAIYQVKTREEAIQRYDSYFDLMYRGNEDFRNIVNEIAEKYKNGETVYLECYCKPLPCHGDIIAKKIEQMVLRERNREAMEKREKMKREND
jgi:hypothetical protein